MASDPWGDTHGGARGQNLGYLILFFFFNLFFVIFKQHVLFRTDYLCMTSDIRVHDLGMGKSSKPMTPLKCYFIFLTYADILLTIY